MENGYIKIIIRAQQMHILPPIVEDQVLFVSSFEKKFSVLELAPLHVLGADHDY